MNLASYLLHDSKNIALVDGSDVLSYKELSNRALKLSAALIKKENIKPNDRVVILAHNSVEFVITYLALLCSGTVVVPLDPNAKEVEIARDISLAKPKLIITSTSSWVPDSFLETVAIIEFNSQIWRKYLKHKSGEIVERKDEDIAVMMMTAGASYQPKPAMLSHKAMLTNLKQASSVEALELRDSDVVLAVLPMHHIFGLHVVLGFSLFSESKVIIARTFDAVELANAIDRNTINVVPGVPALFEAFVVEELVSIDYLNEVRLFISGGAPMRSEVRKSFKKKFGHNISEGYGITEASPMISFAENPNVEGDLGKPLPGIEIEIRDTSGAVAVVGDVGQIVVRGKNIFSGYFNDSQSTRKVLDDNGWLYTGDIGIQEESGKITLIDRGSDVIVVSGFSVFPSEVESVLLKSALVKAVSVVGELDTDTGETPICYVVLDVHGDVVDDPKSKRIFEKNLRDHCLEHLARYKVPSKFNFVKDLSIKASGRPLRKSLRSAISNIDDNL